MRYIARKRGEDEEKWGVIGLIHDLDYEKFPDQHCSRPGKSSGSAGGRRNISGGLFLTDGGDVSTSCHRRIWKKPCMRLMNSPGSLSQQL